MWFKRKSKNRRLGRDYILDVKLRSSQVRAARLRMAAISLSIVFATVLGLYLLWRGGGWALDRLVYDNKAFAVETVDVQTDGVLAVEQLRRWAGVRPGLNLLALDLARVKRDLELVSLVQKASVERILPHTLRIRVIEREPLAQVKLPAPSPNGGVGVSVFQLDSQGYVMLPMEPQQRAMPALQPPDQLPLITGLNAKEVQAGHPLESPQIQAALQLLQAFESSPMAGLVDLKQIDISSPEVLVATTGQGSEVTFALAGLEQQLRRWHVIFDSAQRGNKAIASLDLAITNNVPARWVEASTLPPVRARPPRSSRKKHV